MNVMKALLTFHRCTLYGSFPFRCIEQRINSRFVVLYCVGDLPVSLYRAGKVADPGRSLADD